MKSSKQDRVEYWQMRVDELNKQCQVITEQYDQMISDLETKIKYCKKAIKSIEQEGK